MNALGENHTKTYSLLSIGQRGVGKTVFLAGSYTELHNDTQTKRSQIWFDCKSRQEQENIGQLLDYIARTGQYPPPTMKITDFNFSLKANSVRGEQLLCHFRWWEIPGEICQMSERDFREIISASQGCCVFIDADALIHEPAYLDQFEEICELTSRLAFLVVLNELKDYAFALILTKCDKLGSSSFNRQQIEQKLQSLIERLEQVKANYRVFYSHIPIVRIRQGAATLNPQGAATALVWLVCELSHIRAPGSKLNAQTAVAAKKLVVAHSNRLRFTLVLFVTLVGFVGFFSIGYNLLLQTEPNNLTAISSVAPTWQKGLLYLAIPLIEKLVQRQPHDVELRLKLAELYQKTSQLTKAEATYSWVLARQKNNLKALVGKAVVRQAQGDVKTAKTLLTQAEAVAPTNIKAKVHALAQTTLQLP